jgi:hypothetical protein
MGEYYNKMDENEIKRFADQAKANIQEVISLPEKMQAEEKDLILAFA